MTNIKSLNVCYKSISASGASVICSKLNEKQYQLLMQSAGGEEVHTTDMTLPRACPGKCNDINDLSPAVRSPLSPEAQRTFMQRYNSMSDETEDFMKAEQAVWETIHQQYEEDDNGVWS